MRTYYLGIDLGSIVCAGAAVNDWGDDVGAKTVETSERNLIDFVKRWNGNVIVMIEECELAGWAYRTLLPHVSKVIVSDPKRNAWIAKSSFKDDHVDAPKLARLNRMGEYREVYNPKRDDMAAFKKAVQQHETLTDKVKALKCQIKGQFRREGIFVRNRSAYLPEKRNDLLGRVKNDLVKRLITQNINILEFLEKEREEALSLMKMTSRGFKIISSFKKVPGVGPICAARFVAYVQTPHRFNDKRKLWQYSRYGIIDRRSDGKPLGWKRIDRYANGTLKNVGRTIFLGAQRKPGDNLFKRTYRESLARTHNADHARLNTERKILATMWAMWRDGTEYDDKIDEKRA